MLQNSLKENPQECLKTLIVLHLKEHLMIYNDSYQKDEKNKIIIDIWIIPKRPFN